MRDIILRYYGHSSFLWITDQGRKILIDPFGNPDSGRRWFLYKFPRVKADKVLISHHHFDHNALDRILGEPEVIDAEGIYEGNDYRIEAIEGEHVRGYGVLHNLIFLMNFSGISFCHLGDNRAKIERNIQKKLQNVDVLMLPVDSSHHLLTYEEIDHLLDMIKPKIAVPMHYYIPDLTAPESTLGSVEGWLDKRDRIKRIPDGEVTISKERIPTKTEFWVYNGAFSI